MRIVPRRQKVTEIILQENQEKRKPCLKSISNLPVSFYLHFLDHSIFLSYWDSTWSFCIAFVLLQFLLMLSYFSAFAITVSSVLGVPYLHFPWLAPSHPADLPFLTAFSSQRVFLSPDPKSSSILLTSHPPLFHYFVTSFMEVIKFVIIFLFASMLVAVSPNRMSVPQG